MASTKAWHDCCSCVHHEGLCHKREGYCTTSLSALSQLNCTGIDRGCLASPMLSDVWRCHAHALPACLGWEAVPDATTWLLLTQPSWLAVVSQAATELTTIDGRAFEKWDGALTQSSEPKPTPSLSIYSLLEGQRRKKRCYTGDWVTHIWLTSVTVKRVGVSWVYPVGIRVCYIRLCKDTVRLPYNTPQRGEKNLLIHALHTTGAQHTWLKNTSEDEVQHKNVVIRVNCKLPLPDSQHTKVLGMSPCSLPQWEFSLEQWLLL